MAEENETVETVETIESVSNVDSDRPNIDGDDLVYFSVFPKTGGGRITSYVVGIHANTISACKAKAEEDFPDAVVIKQTRDEWGKTCDDNLYYDAESGELVDPPEPTEEELREQALTALDYEYETKISDIESEMAKAAAIGDDDLLAELREERAALVAEYEEKREAI